MTKQQEAQELVDMFMNLKPAKLSDYSKIYQPTAKQCALIHLDGLIKYAKTWGDATELDIKHFEELKEEVKNL